MDIKPILLYNYDKWLDYQHLLTLELLQTLTIQTLEVTQQLPLAGVIEFAVVFESNAELKKLNKNFRFIDKPTNVLSFPLYEINNNHRLVEYINDNYIYLGDMVFAYETIAEESVVQDKIFLNHFMHLFIHSLLHLMGYDHMEENEASIMENLEIKILKRFNIDSPY